MIKILFIVTILFGATMTQYVLWGLKTIRNFNPETVALFYEIERVLLWTLIVIFITCLVAIGL